MRQLLKLSMAIYFITGSILIIISILVIILFPTACCRETSLEITGITVINVTTDGAEITWDTSEPSTSQVFYDTASHADADDYEWHTTLDTTLESSHSMVLDGLDPDTTYHFRARSEDAAGNERTSEDQTFTTADATAPVITGIEVINITTESAEVTWNASEPANGSVFYDTVSHADADDYDLSWHHSLTSESSHSLVLDSLTPFTTYHFRVRSEDAAGNERTSEDQTFTTLHSIRFNMQTRSDWTTFDLVSGGNWLSPVILESDVVANEADFIDGRFILTQDIEYAVLEEPIEMTVEAGLTDIDYEETLVFEIGRGYLGSTHIEVYTWETSDYRLLGIFDWGGIVKHLTG